MRDSGARKDLPPRSRPPITNRKSALEPHLDALQEAIALALGLELGVLRERQVNEAALPGRERGKKNRPARPAHLVGRGAGELVERLLSVSAEVLGIEARMDRPAHALGGDPAHEDLEAGQSLALVGEQRLDV